MKRRRISEAAAAAVGLFILIIDSKTALGGAREGLEICIRVLIPTLFPFIFLSSYLSGKICYFSIPGSSFISRLFRIPKGAETMLLCGILGGYPVGAMTVDEAVNRGQIDPKDGKRLLCICNQCGPAFIFGMSAVLFDSPLAGWLLMLIQVFSALITAHLIPGSIGTVQQKMPDPLPRQPMAQAIRSTANICGWVIMFKILVTFLQRWTLWLFSAGAKAAIVGFLEMSNGCLLLPDILQPELRFVLCAAFLNFGGLCVTMQAFSLVKYTDKGLYIPGKLLQCAVASSLSLALWGKPVLWMPLTFSLILCLILRKNEKRCGNSRTVVV